MVARNCSKKKLTDGSNTTGSQKGGEGREEDEDEDEKVKEIAGHEQKQAVRSRKAAKPSQVTGSHVGRARLACCFVAVT
jgi:hypothetical protein